MSTTYRFPSTGEPKTQHIHIKGKQPTPEEAARLTRSPSSKKPVSGKEALDAMKWFALGILVGIGAWFFGHWVIDNFVGPGVLFFGYGAAYIGTPVLIIFGLSSLYKLFRSAQKTKPEASLGWVYSVSLLGDDGGGRFGKPDYALATLKRAVHDQTPFNESQAAAYIKRFRDTLTGVMELTTAPAKADPPKTWSEGSAQKSLKIDGVKDLFPGAKEVNATLTYKDTLTYSDGKNNTHCMFSAILELHISHTFVQSGKYWYPYDIYPGIETTGSNETNENGGQ